MAIDIDNPTLLTRVGVGNLVAVKGATEREYLIGVTSRVTRAMREEILEDSDDSQDDFELGPTPDDVLIATLVGTFRTIRGGKG